MRIKIHRVKLGRQKIWGQSDGSTVQIDERLKGKKELEIILHECLHHLYPAASEKEVEHKSIILTNTLWAERYRKIDDSNEHPLQNGKL